MGTWKWKQPGDRVWKVVSDYEAGTIYVYNEKGKLIYKQEGLSEKAIQMVEKNFLDTIALNGKKKRPSLADNPMYV